MNLGPRGVWILGVVSYCLLFFMLLLLRAPGFRNSPRDLKICLASGHMGAGQYWVRLSQALWTCYPCSLPGKVRSSFTGIRGIRLPSRAVLVEFCFLLTPDFQNYQNEERSAQEALTSIFKALHPNPIAKCLCSTLYETASHLPKFHLCSHRKSFQFFCLFYNSMEMLLLLAHSMKWM